MVYTAVIWLSDPLSLSLFYIPTCDNYQSCNYSAGDFEVFHLARVT